MSTIAMPLVEVNVAEVTRKNRLARARRIARRHNLRILTRRCSENDQCYYEVQAAVPVSGQYNFQLPELEAFCRNLAQSDGLARKECR